MLSLIPTLLFITLVESAATDYNGQASPCVANGYSYCPSTQICFEDLTLPTPDPSQTLQINIAESKTKLGCAAPKVSTNNTNLTPRKIQVEPVVDLPVTPAIVSPTQVTTVCGPNCVKVTDALSCGDKCVT